MTNFLPFPPALAEESAKNAKASASAKTGPGDHDIQGIAVYRTQEGRLRAAHDLYDPQFPEGAEPGIGTLHCKLHHYPNDTSGYEMTASGFQPAAEYLRDHPLQDPDRRADPMDRLALAHVRTGGASGFIWALDECQMKGWTDALPEDAQVTRACLTRHGMEPGAVVTAVFMAKTAGGREMHVAPSTDALADGLRKRFSFIKTEGLDAGEVISRIGEHGRERGWVTASAMIDAGGAMHHGPGCSCASCVVRAGNEWIRDILGSTPDAALIRPRQPVAIGMIQRGGEQVLLHAADAASLTQHLTRSLRTLRGEGREGSDTRSDAEYVSDLASAGEVKIHRLQASAALAYGGEPAHLAVLADHSCVPPRLLAFAAGTDANLAQDVRTALELHLPDLTGTRDMADIRSALWASDRFTLFDMKTEDLDQRVREIRAADGDAALEP